MNRVPLFSLRRSDNFIFQGVLFFGNIQADRDGGLLYRRLNHCRSGLPHCDSSVGAGRRHGRIAAGEIKISRIQLRPAVRKCPVEIINPKCSRCARAAARKFPRRLVHRQINDGGADGNRAGHLSAAILCQRHTRLLIIEILYPVPDTLVIPKTSDPNPLQIQIKDIRLMPLGTHPAAHHGIRCQISHRNILRDSGTSIPP